MGEMKAVSEQPETKPGVSRRAILGKAIGVTAGAVRAGLLGAAPAAASTGDKVVAGQETTSEASTTIKYDGSAPLTGIVLLANDTAYTAAAAMYPAALGGWAGNSVVNGVYGYTSANNGNGVVGVDSAASGGTGVLATSTVGTALKVSGKVAFNRSGRASVPKSKAYVDVIVPGGLGATANIIATLQTYRSGVWLAGVRRNYPAAGKVRIYLNKVASTTTTTPVAWFVIG